MSPQHFKQQPLRFVSHLVLNRKKCFFKCIFEKLLFNKYHHLLVKNVYFLLSFSSFLMCVVFNSAAARERDLQGQVNIEAFHLQRMWRYR